MGKNPPAFQFYGRDFACSTAEWSNAEVGAYIRLLIHQWENGDVPHDAPRAARICGDSEGVDVALQKFDADDRGRGKNRRLEDVREDYERFREQRVKAGKKSAAVRWGRKDSSSGRYNERTNSRSTGVVTGSERGGNPAPAPPSPTTDSTSEPTTITDARAREAGLQEVDDLEDERRGLRELIAEDLTDITDADRRKLVSDVESCQTIGELRAVRARAGALEFDGLVQEGRS